MSAYYLAASVLGFIASLYILKSCRLPAPLPPGPKGWPLLGNITNLPWVKFAELGREYGGIVYLSALGKSIIILYDAKYAFDMLAKKGENYSDRPKLIMAGELIGWGESPVLTPKGVHEIQNLTWGQFIF